MKQYLFSALVLFFAALVISADDTIPLKKKLPTDDLSGIWEAHGVTVDTDGEPAPYTSVVTIMRHRDGYLCQWSAGPGANTVGVAARDGDGFIVAWSSLGKMGLSQFKIDKDSKGMSGRWMVFPSTTWQLESLKWIAPLPKLKELEST